MGNTGPPGGRLFIPKTITPVTLPRPPLPPPPRNRNQRNQPLRKEKKSVLQEDSAAGAQFSEIRAIL